MLRLQTPLAERYTDATPDELDARIAAAKATLGDRLFILGHHYQRDEVIRWADARGDSFRLSVLAAGARPRPTYIVFCGVHFMAESADVLTGDHQQVILPDLNAGCSMADMADLDEVEEAWEALAGITDIDRVIPITYMNSSAALKAFVGRARRRRVHVDQRPGRARVGPRQLGGRSSAPARRQGAVLPRPAPRPQHRPRHGLRPTTTCGCGTRASSAAASPRPTCKEATLPALEGPLLGAPALPPRARRRRSGPSTPTASWSCTPSAATTSCELADQVGSTDFIIRAVDEAPGRLGDRRRHRDPPGEPPRTTRRPTRPSCRSTRWSARARRCSASTPRTCAGCSRTSSRGGS